MSSEMIDTKTIQDGGHERFFHHGLYRQIKFVEEAILIVSAVSHLLMLRLIPPDNLWVNRWTETFVCLLIYYGLSRIDLVDRSLKARIVVLSLATMAACGAYTLGQPVVLNPLFAVLVARVVLFIEGKLAWWVAGSVYFLLCLSSFLRYWIWTWNGEPLELGSAVVLLLPTFFYGTLWQGVVMAMVALLVQSLIASKKQMLEMERLNKEVSALAADLERARIARDIHDGVGHSLTSLSVQLEVARKLLKRDQERAELALGEAERMAKRCLRDVRNSIALMRVDEFDFAEAIGSLLDGIESGGTIKIEKEIDMPALAPITSYQIFRIIQESCTNCIRHSGADQLKVSIAANGNNADNNGKSLNIVVKDNGKGFNADAKFNSFGLTGIRERVDDLHGNLEIVSGDGVGTTVTVLIPIADSAETGSAIIQQ
jgi:signal transduction histidine kinase